MEMLVQLGCAAIAAPPYGQMEGVTLEALAERFSRLTDLAKTIGIEPYLEFWGRSKILSNLNEALFVARSSRTVNVKILIDPFHMYVGGSDVTDLSRLRGNNIGIVHVNDYPPVPSLDQIEDRDRVFPGDGIAPSSEIAKLLYHAGYRGYLSLELFIENYGNVSALEVAKLGLKKIKTAHRVAADSDDSVKS
jgi:2-keto-myo-inositol isomerase